MVMVKEKSESVRMCVGGERNGRCGQLHVRMKVGGKVTKHPKHCSSEILGPTPGPRCHLTMRLDPYVYNHPCTHYTVLHSIIYPFHPKYYFHPPCHEVEISFRSFYRLLLRSTSAGGPSYPRGRGQRSSGGLLQFLLVYHENVILKRHDLKKGNVERQLGCTSGHYTG